METKVALTKDEEAVDVDVHLYRSMIGSIMYLTASRPDIMYAVCVCSRFQVTPKTSHLNAVNIQDDPLVSLVQGLVTPSKTTVNASEEEQVEDISPNTLEVAKTLSRVASQKPKSIDKGRRYKRRKQTKGKKVVTSLDFQEEVSNGYAEGVNTGKLVLLVDKLVLTVLKSQFLPLIKAKEKEKLL
ncbi:hypothetical protein Tco_0202605 [Tanacetum coccineum]